MEEKSEQLPLAEMPSVPLLASASASAASSPLIVTLAVLGAVVIGLFLLHTVGYWLLRRRQWAQPTQVFGHSVVRNLRLPTSLIVPLVGLEIALAATKESPGTRSWLLHGTAIAIVVAVAFLLVRLTYVLEDVLLARHRLDIADNLRARELHTQVKILRRIAVVAVAVVAAAVILLGFREVRLAGASLLASAGIVGIVTGVAARPTLANIVAGVQIAISQPIRVDDVVVVEQQWGRIEEISLTYVVVRLWDRRHLVLPISYFVANPFENWTRSTADIVGWVYIEVDHTAPVDAIRQHLHEVLAASPNWDGNVWNLQVSNTGPSTMQLRAMMSSPSSSASWDLQCEVRERVMAFLVAHYPSALPRVRTQAVEMNGVRSEA